MCTNEEKYARKKDRKSHLTTERDTFVGTRSLELNLIMMKRFNRLV